MEEPNSVLTPDLDTVREQFKKWRANKRNAREPIPEELWKAAQNLSKRYSVNQVAQYLRLNFTDLKKRVLGGKYQPAKRLKPEPFIEIPCEPIYNQSECVIEMEDKSGCRMKMCFRGETRIDLLELGKAFWNKKR